jgi:hypothetical protein
MKLFIMVMLALAMDVGLVVAARNVNTDAVGNFTFNVKPTQLVDGNGDTWPITYEKIPDHMVSDCVTRDTVKQHWIGVTDLFKRTVTIDPSLSNKDARETLLHEMHHVALHEDDDDSYNACALSTEDEFIEESAGALETMLSDPRNAQVVHFLTNR